MHVATRRRIWLVGAAVAATAVLLPLGARAVAVQTRSDTLWANALRSLGGSQQPFDFAIFLAAGDDVLHGHNPYPDPSTVESSQRPPYAYPPVLALLVAPAAALPEYALRTFLPGVGFSLVVVFSILGALWLLGVRDWRCYPIALLYPVTIETVEYGAVGPLLLLLVALLWRFRDRIWLSAGSAGLAIVLKGFLWPLALWLLATRRVRAAAGAVAAAVGLAVASWAIIAFRGFRDYPDLLRKLVDKEAENSYSAFAVLRMLEIPAGVANALVLVGGAALLVLAWRAARDEHSGRLDRDRRSLLLVLGAALVLTPILWLHYLVLLLVPLALTRPRLAPLWLVPLVPTVFEALDWYRGWPQGDRRALLSTAALIAIVFGAALSGRLRTRDPAVARAA